MPFVPMSPTNQPHQQPVANESALHSRTMPAMVRLWSPFQEPEEYGMHGLLRSGFASFSSYKEFIGQHVSRNIPKLLHDGCTLIRFLLSFLEIIHRGSTGRRGQ